MWKSALEVTRHMPTLLRDGTGVAAGVAYHPGPAVPHVLRVLLRDDGTPGGEPDRAQAAGSQSALR
jgi:hypothetical protein